MIDTPPRLDGLNPAFRVKAEYVIKSAAADGIRLEPFWAVLTPIQQAGLWCQSRSKEEIQQGIEKLEAEGAPFLANVLRKTDRTYGRWETNDLPGQSWHQWGEALALRVVSDTARTIWNPTHPSYEHMAVLARKVNLATGLYWKNKDAMRLQLRSDAVRAYYAWTEIDKLMKERYREPTYNQSSKGPGSGPDDSWRGSTRRDGPRTLGLPVHTTNRR